MTTQPTPRHIAHAITDLAAERVRGAWRYLDTWTALEAGGVPHEQIRDVLDRSPVDTEAVSEVRQWAEDGERGCFVLHGAQDCGKTYAAAWWARDRHARGLPTMWISAATWGRLTFDEIRPLLRRAERADALVIDDAGCGASQGEHFRRTIEALLLERAGRPTLITGNLNEAQMVGVGNTPGWLGSRIVSRLRVSGGRKHIARSLDMRQRDLTMVDPATGHGEAWKRAAALVAAIGCERSTVPVMRTEYDDKGGQWEEPTGEYVERLDVGVDFLSRVGKLTKQIERLEKREAPADRIREVRHRRRDLLRLAAQVAELNPAEVKARAAELVGTLSDFDAGDMIGELAADIAAKMSALEAAASAGRRAENEYRAKVCYDTLEAMATRSRALPLPPPRSPNEAPSWTQGAEGVRSMKAQGYYVRPRSDGYDLYRRRSKSEVGVLVVARCASPDDAWQACRQLWGSGW
jgi:hypothetical protein